MDQRIVLLSRALVWMMAIAVLLVLLVLLPEIAREELAENPESRLLALPYLIAAWVLAAPVFVALYQTHKLIGYVDNDQIISARSLRALRNIKWCTLAFGALIIGGVILVTYSAKSVDPQEDATAFFGIGFMLLLVTSIVAASTAILQRLVEGAITIKSENDQTV